MDLEAGARDAILTSSCVVFPFSDIVVLAGQCQSSYLYYFVEQWHI